jgi:hypothetical protein
MDVNCSIGKEEYIYKHGCIYVHKSLDVHYPRLFYTFSSPSNGVFLVFAQEVKTLKFFIDDRKQTCACLVGFHWSLSQYDEYSAGRK